MSNFYWPGVYDDVKRYCRSCEVCQRASDSLQGSVPKAPLGKMTQIEIPFKRIVVEIIGPFYPASEECHKYILTLVDYTTRYPEAVSLTNITTQSVAEGFVDIYSRVDIPEEVIIEQGRQFISGCMPEVSRLLDLCQLSTTPY